ncbi:MAG: hypothetical protein GKR87_07970 [Kiritimatiellae bacterium]|nr:hypothetical protein [Kiritimatiellia bacterium]
MSLENYREQTETIHDAERIEEWKQSVTRQVVYLLKGKKGLEEMTWSAAESYFKEKIAPAVLQKVRRVIIPSATARQLDDEWINEKIRR